jgi:hypothetical protein
MPLPPQPNYRSYIQTDLAALMRGAGLEPSWKEVASTSKSLSFVKPAARAAA